MTYANNCTIRVIVIEELQRCLTSGNYRHPEEILFSNGSISSILKRKQQRDNRIQDIQNKVFSPKLGKLKITYYQY